MSGPVEPRGAGEAAAEVRQGAAGERQAAAATPAQQAAAPAAAQQAAAAAPARPQKVLLFGGTFDPPHAGHMHNLSAAIRAVQPDYVLVMPACIPPHKAASATPANLRLAMCRCFEPLFPALEVSDWEIAQQGKSYTIDTVRMLARRFEGAALYLCVGSDMLLTFRQWRCWRQLLSLVTLVVQSREPGDEAALRTAAQSLAADGGHVLLTDAPALPMTSSEIRAKGGAGELLPLVETIARQHHLYGR